MYLCRQLRHTTFEPVLLLNTIQVNNHILEVMYKSEIYIPIMYKII